MDLSGTWQFAEQWTVGKEKPTDEFTATFNPDGTVSIDHSLGFAMVWNTGGQPEIILAGDHVFLGILATYYGTMGSDGKSMSGTANGKMVIPFEGTVPVTGTWSATQVS